MSHHRENYTESGSVLRTEQVQVHSLPPEQIEGHYTGRAAGIKTPTTRGKVRNTVKKTEGDTEVRMADSKGCKKKKKKRSTANGNESCIKGSGRSQRSGTSFILLGQEVQSS